MNGTRKIRVVWGPRGTASVTVDGEAMGGGLDRDEAHELVAELQRDAAREGVHAVVIARRVEVAS